MALEVGKDPLDLIGMLDGTIEEMLRNSDGQSQREIFQAIEDSIERFRRNLDQGRAVSDFHFHSNLETNSDAREHVPAPRIGRTLRGSSPEIQGLDRYLDHVLDLFIHAMDRRNTKEIRSHRRALISGLARLEEAANRTAQANWWDKSTVDALMLDASGSAAGVLEEATCAERN
jgi:hypothetical protein